MDMNKAIGNRIKSRRKELELTQEQVGNIVGVNKSTIQRYENGLIKELKMPVVQAIANALNVDLNWLVLKSENKSSITSNSKPTRKTKLIPLVGTVACGNPIYAEENIQEYISVDINDNVDFALYAKGDSMNNCKIDDGDIIYIRQQPVVENGEIALVLVDNSATIKRFYDYGDKIVLRPDSTNPTHKEQVYSKTEYNLLIQGKVIFVKTYVS